VKTLCSDPRTRRFRVRFQFLGCALLAGDLLAGCRTPVREESFSIPFDAPKVAQLSHQASRVAWDAAIWARHDLRFAAFRPTILDYEVVDYLYEITQRVPWVALKVEKNPASPRVASKNAYDIVAYDAMMLRLRYQPTSFRVTTDAKIESVLSLMDQMAPYYAQNQQPP
jgi:hypothetical protein